MTALPSHAEDSCLKNQGTPKGPSSPVMTTPRDSGVLEKPEEDGSGPDTASAPQSDRESTIRPSSRDSSRIGDAEYGPPVNRAVSAASTLDFPEGGVEGWLVVFGSFCAMISVFGLINSAAVFESYFSTNQLADHTSSEIGWIFSLYLFIVFFVGIQVGPIFDAYGPRLLVASGSLLVALSLFVLSWCTTYYQIILTYSVLGGLGGALLNPPAYGCIAHYFNARRGLATGIATTSGGVGGIIFPIILQNLLPNRGFPWSCRILAFIMLGLAVPANLFLRTRLPPPSSHHVTSVWPDVTIFKDLRFAFASAGIIFMELGLFIPLTFLVSYAAAHGQDPTESYVLLSYLNAASVVGRVLPGFLADRYGRFNVILATIALCVATVLGIWLPARHSEATLIAYAVLFGFASGSNLGLIPVCLGQLCDARKYGRYYSTAMMVASFGTLSSVPLGGALLGIGGEVGWRALILFSGVSYAVALACYATARVLAVGWNPSIVF